MIALTSSGVSPSDLALGHRRLRYAGVVLIRGLIVTVCAVLCLTACGSAGHETKAKAKAPSTACTNRKAIAKLQADIAAMRRAAALPTKDRLLGNKPINAATDRFLNDVAVAKIDNKRRNRLIDHAAGTLAGACEQCFQALEAARPVVGIRLGVSGC
jgi:hypothetical protein